jgi:Uma2 family endonuclease
VSGAAHKKPTIGAAYADLSELPAHVVGKLVFGVVHASPRPAPKHARAASRLGGALDGPFDRGMGGPGGWILLDEPELHLGTQVLVPDLAGWRRERMPELPVESAFIDLAPDWVCEVLTPSTSALDRGDKRKVYEAERVAHVWFVDPDARTLEVLALDGASYRLIEVYAESVVVRAPPFDAVELDLGALWARQAGRARHRAAALEEKSTGVAAMNPRTARRLIAVVLGAVIGTAWWLYEHNQAQGERLLRELQQRLERAEQEEGAAGPGDR